MCPSSGSAGEMCEGARAYSGSWKRIVGVGVVLSDKRGRWR